MASTRCFYGAAHEGFAPSELISQAVAAEEAGFEGIERIREIDEMGSTITILMNITGEDPGAAFSTYGEKVLPALRGQ